jgi:histidinol-phosphatase (PHP family)
MNVAPPALYVRIRPMEHPPDYHIHTRFSCDCESTPEEVCQAAIDRGIREIAITDHADFEPLDACCEYLRPLRHWEAVQHCRDKYAGQLTVRIGIECGEAHVYKKQFSALLSTFEYDFVLGSLHWARGRPTFDQAFFDGLDVVEALGLYFEELVLLAAEGDFDVLAHFDFLRRAIHQRFGSSNLETAHHEPLIREALRTLAERGKGIEVNTAMERRGMGPPGPSVQILEWFREEGGEIVTVGSDSHFPEHVGAGSDLALEMITDAGFNRLATFHRRSIKWQNL